MRVESNQLLSTIPMDDEFFSLEQVEDIQSMLGDMAQQPRTTFTKKQTIEAIIDDIEQALETRSFQEVAEGLTQKGLDVSVAALRQYVSRYRRSQKKTAAGKHKKRSSATKKTAKKQPRTGQGPKQQAEEKAATKQTAAEQSLSRFVGMDEDL